MIRRLTPPQLPAPLREAGWRLRHGPYGWHCSTATGQATLVYGAPGAAIAAAWNVAEPAYERRLKRARDHAWLFRGLGLL